MSSQPSAEELRGGPRPCKALGLRTRPQGPGEGGPAAWLGDGQKISNHFQAVVLSRPWGSLIPKPCGQALVRASSLCPESPAAAVSYIFGV